MIKPSYSKAQIAKARKAAASCLPGSSAETIDLRLKQPTGRPPKRSDNEIRAALKKSGGDLIAAAVALDLHPTTVGRRAKTLGVGGIKPPGRPSNKTKKRKSFKRL